MNRKPKKPAPPIEAIVWPRSTQAEMAGFDPKTKICTMNCGRHRADPRSPEEFKFQCTDCVPAGHQMSNDAKEIQQAPPSMLKFTGTPVEIGGQIWARMCLPAVRHVSNNADPLSLAQLYAGIIMSGLGAMTADFGHPQALAFFEQMKDAFTEMADDPEMRGTTVQ